MSARRSAPSLALFALACASVLAPAGASHGYAVTGSKWNVRSLPIRYRVNASTAPASLGSAAALTAVQQAFATWEAPACTAWRSQNAGSSTVTLASQDDGENTILWVPSGWNADPRNNPMGDVRGTIGVTQTSRIVGGSTNESDISFNAQGFRWSTTGTGGTVDAQSIAVHEEGHFLGLDHSPITGAIMYASYTSGTKRVLHSDDQAGVCALYPSGTTVPDAGTPDTGTPTDSGTGAPGVLGGSCSRSVRCAGDGVCVCRDASQTNCVCSLACSTSDPCPAGFLCSATSLGGLCLADPSGSMTMMPGTGTTGEPCEGGDECASGICVQTRADTAVCTQACANDCSCPSSYQCAMTTSGTNVCVPGTNTCATTSPDAGVRDTGVRDTGAPSEDAGTQESDAQTMEAGTDAGTGGGTTPGCACAVPGAGVSRGAARSVWAAPWALLALAGAVRVRSRKRR